MRPGRPGKSRAWAAIAVVLFAASLAPVIPRARAASSSQPNSVNSVRQYQGHELAVSRDLLELTLQARAEQCALRAASHEEVWLALLATVGERGESIQTRVLGDSLETAFRLIDVRELGKIAVIEGGEKDWEKGRYKLHARLSALAIPETELTVVLTIQGWRKFAGPQDGGHPAPMRPANWVPLPSNGALEKKVCCRMCQLLRGKEESFGFQRGGCESGNG